MRILAGGLVAAILILGPAHHSAAEDKLRLEIPEELNSLMEEMFEEMKPFLGQALELMDQFEENYDPRHYEMPEFLPNGDIIIRRREEAPEFTPGAPAPDNPQSDGSIKT